MNKHSTKRIVSFITALMLIMSLIPVSALAEEIQNTEQLDEMLKSYLTVTSKNSSDNITAIINSDYGFSILLPEDKTVDISSVEFELAMRNVALLGVTDTMRSSQTVTTQENAADVSLLELMPNAYDSAEKYLSVSIDGENAVYIVSLDDGTIGAYTQDVTSAEEIWSSLAGHFTTSTKEDTANSITVKNGSYIRTNTEYVHFENAEGDLELNNLGSFTATDAAVRAALKLDSVASKDSKIIVFLKKGSELAIGQNVASLNDDLMLTIELDEEAMSELPKSFAKIGNASASDPVSSFKAYVGVLDDLLGAICSSEETAITIHRHEFDTQNTDTEFLCTPATCTEKEKYYYSCTCGEASTSTFEYGETNPHNYQNHICPDCGAIDADLRLYLGAKSGGALELITDKDNVIAIRLPQVGAYDASSMTVGTVFQTALGLSGKVEHKLTLDSGISAPFKTLMYNTSVSSGAKLNSKIDDKEFVYIFSSSGNTITGTPVESDAAGAAWDALASHLDVTATDSQADSLTVKNGSYIKLGTEHLHFKNDTGDLTISDLRNVLAADTAVRDALKLDTIASEGGRISVFLKEGSKITIGSTVLTLKDDYMLRIELDSKKMVDGILESIKEADSASDKLNSLFGALDAIVGVISECEEVDVSLHKHVFDQEVEADEHLVSAAACETKPIYYKSCTCGDNGTDTFSPDKPLEHLYTYEYVWTGISCKATCTCTRPGCGHSETETATGVYQKDTDASCIECEKGHYKAGFTNPIFTEQNTEAGSVDNGAALGHNYGTPTYSWDGIHCTAERVCTRDESHIESETVSGTYEKDTAATCTACEYGHYNASFENKDFSDQSSGKDSVPNGAALKHKYTVREDGFGWSESGRSCTVTVVCVNDPTHTYTVKADVTSKITKPASTTEMGQTTYTAKVEVEGKTYTGTKTVTDVPMEKEQEESTSFISQFLKFFADLFSILFSWLPFVN